MLPYTKPKLFRDPIHDIIAITPDGDDGRLLLRLVDTREVQRLRRIRQLGLTNVVYHGADHSRFAHSMGVAHLAQRMLRQLARRGVDISADDRLVTLAAALLHDVGHGPFSHVLERFTGADHEGRSAGLVQDPDSQVHAALSDFDPSLPEAIVGRLTGDDGAPQFLHEIVSSQLDADRLDYILRDGHATGVKIGSFDLQRILAMLDVHNNHLAVHEGAREAVEGYLLARFHMYTQVYLHRTSRSAERMLRAALERAGALHRDGYAFSWWPGGTMGKLLAGEAIAPAAFADLDDADVWLCFKNWEREADRVLAEICSGLLYRGLWKTFSLPVGDRESANALVGEARARAAALGFDPDYDVLVDESKDSPYQPMTGDPARSRSIRMVDSTGRGFFIEEESEVIRMFGRLLHQQRLLCVHPRLRDPLRPLFGP
ncbi:MAG: HD domain-containing protein [Candidatus Schekmanbacteria bacterium]|nr:HD domain-containing protein [Candidatus Schekmanbacteria bacterium]